VLSKILLDQIYGLNVLFPWSEEKYLEEKPILVFSYALPDVVIKGEIVQRVVILNDFLVLEFVKIHFSCQEFLDAGVFLSCVKARKGL
jgi:hypothetical protein